MITHMYCGVKDQILKLFDEYPQSFEEALLSRGFKLEKIKPEIMKKEYELYDDPDFDKLVCIADYFDFNTIEELDPEDKLNFQIPLWDALRIMDEWAKIKTK